VHGVLKFLGIKSVRERKARSRDGEAHVAPFDGSSKKASTNKIHQSGIHQRFLGPLGHDIKFFIGQLSAMLPRHLPD
jgi:hypothetical protein